MSGWFLRGVKFWLAAFALIGCYNVTALRAQERDKEPVIAGIEIQALGKTGSRDIRCSTKDEVISEQRYREIAADPRNKDCPDIREVLRVDFSKHTLISFQTGGDCFLRVRSRVFRNDKAKKFTVSVRNIYGGCRAGGWYQGWLTVDKIPANYKVEFIHSRADSYMSRDFDDGDTYLSPALFGEKVASRRIDLKNCITTYQQKSYIIRDEETYLKTVRHDASREQCLKEVEKIDFAKYDLLGIEVNSGYCGIPIGLKTEARKETEKKQYVLHIEYIPPQESCRALSQYDVWTLIPKMSPGYDATFRIQSY